MNRINTKMKVEPKDIDLNKLKEAIQYGDAKTIAEKTDYSHQYVRQVLSPKSDRYNAKIIIAAVELVKDRVRIELDPDIAKKLTKNGTKSVRKNGSD